MMKNCILILALLSAGCGNRMVTENIGEQISQYQIWLDSLSKADTIFDGKSLIICFSHIMMMGYIILSIEIQ